MAVIIKEYDENTTEYTRTPSALDKYEHVCYLYRVNIEDQFMVPPGENLKPAWQNYLKFSKHY